MAKKLLPYINRFTGELKVMTKADGKDLSEDWSRAKMATNDEGKRVFRFKLSAPVKGRDGKVHMGTAIVDLSENDEALEGDVEDGNRDSA